MERSKGWYIKQSFSNDFVDLLTSLYKKYGESVFEIQGIANRHMDLVQFSKNFFSKSGPVADVSIDSNANVKERNITQYNYEKDKSLTKLNSLYLLYKYVKKVFSVEDAKKALEKTISGELFVNDLTHYDMPYSYFQETPIFVKINGVEKYLTMKQIFDYYSEFSIKLSDREEINLEDVYKEVDFGRRVFIERENGRIEKTIKGDNFKEKVKQYHNIEIRDGDGRWVKLNKILRHKNERELILYQTENGDFAFVTSDHPIILYDSSEINAESLKEGMEIKGSDYISDINEFIDVPDDLSYIIGFLIGDGNVGRHKFYHQSKNLTNEDVSIVITEKENNIVIYQKNIRQTEIYKKIKNTFPNLNIRLLEDRDRILFSSFRFKMLLAKYFDLDYCNSSFTKTLPSNILSWKKHSKESLISGIIDSDGGIKDNGTAQIRVTSYSIITQMADVLYSIGINSNKRVCANDFLFGISFRINDSIKEKSLKGKNVDKEKYSNYNVNMNTASRSNKVIKVIRYQGGFKKLTYSNENILEYVYDVTTETGTFYANGMTQHNCFAFDLRNILMKGMDFYKGSMKIKPPKTSNSFMNLIVQTTSYISNQIMGAASYPDFFAVLDWYYRKELGEDYIKKIKTSKEMYYKIKNQFQNFIYSMNWPFRGNQSLTYDEEIIVNGKCIKIGDLVEENLPEGEKICENKKDLYTYSFNKKTGLFEEKKIKGFIKHDLKNSVVKIKTALGQEIYCTEDHSLFTLDGLEIKEATSKNIENVLIPFDIVKDKISNTLKVKNYGGKYPPCNIILTPELMYMIGQYIGDGSISKSGTLRLSTHDKKADSILEEMTKNYFTSTKRKGRININLGKNFGLSLIDEFGKTASQKRIPRYYYNDINILYLIGGYIDSDGHYRENRGDIKITSINRKLLEDVQFILLANGILSTITKQYKETNYGINMFYQLVIANEFAIKLSDYIFLKKPKEKKNKPNYQRLKVDFCNLYNILDEKYNIYGIGCQLKTLNKKSLTIDDIKLYKEQILDCLSTGSLYKFGSKNRENLSDEKRKEQLVELLDVLKKFDNILPIKIVSIEEVDYIDSVYDISVEDNENFLTSSNLYAHNSAFTNVSIMDKGFMESLFKEYIYPDFTKPNIDSIIELSKSFFEYYTEINCSEGVFTFPIVTIAISLNENREYIDSEFVDWAARINSKKSLANIFQDKPTSFSSCCRLKNDFSEVASEGYHNSFGVGGLSIGSHRVAGLNLPRLAILEKENPNILEENLDILHKILYSHRILIKDRIDRGALPLYTTNWISLSRQYSTIGFIGAYEYVCNKGLDILTKEGQDSLLNVLNKIENKVLQWKKEEASEKNIYNIEQIPGESMAVRLSEIDYILGYNKKPIDQVDENIDIPYLETEKKFDLYSNQYISLTENVSIYERLFVQGVFDKLTSGGAILHINVDDEILISESQFKRLMNAARVLNVTYFAINYSFSECEDGHYLIGKKEVCPICEKNITQQYTRVVGFITPVSSWNKTRKNIEYPNRLMYKNEALNI